MLRSLLPLRSALLQQQHKNTRGFGVWSSWVITAFNRIDQNRLKLVGPDRLAAEWLLKNGAACELDIEGPTGQLWLNDYNRLPWLKETNMGQKPSLAIRLLKVDGKGAELTDTGLQHLRNLPYLSDLKLNYCRFISDAAIEHIVTNPVLERLELQGTQVTLNGVRQLTVLKRLQYLDVSQTQVQESDVAPLKDVFKQALPKCEVVT